MANGVRPMHRRIARKKPDARAAHRSGRMPGMMEKNRRLPQDAERGCSSRERHLLRERAPSRHNDHTPGFISRHPVHHRGRTAWINPTAPVPVAAPPLQAPPARRAHTKGFTATAGTRRPHPGRGRSPASGAAAMAPSRRRKKTAHGRVHQHHSKARVSRLSL